MDAYLPGPFGAEPLVILLAALLLDAVWRDLDWLYRVVPHPVAASIVTSPPLRGH